MRVGSGASGPPEKKEPVAALKIGSVLVSGLWTQKYWVLVRTAPSVFSVVVGCPLAATKVEVMKLAESGGASPLTRENVNVICAQARDEGGEARENQKERAETGDHQVAIEGKERAS